MPVAKSEEQQVAIELHETGPTECQALMGKSRIGEAPRASAPECLLLLLCLYMLATAVPLHVGCCCQYLTWCGWGWGIPTAFNVV